MMSALLPNLSHRQQFVEWMERPDCDLRKLRRTLAAFRWTNRLYARYPYVLNRWLVADLRPHRHYQIADVGCGGGDIAAWLAHRCRQLGLNVTVHALDADARAVACAWEWYGDVPGLVIRHADALDPEVLADMDGVYANHVLHHLRDDQIIAFLRSLAGRKFVISDLLRRYHAYYVHSLIGACFPGTYIGVDGRLSLRRAFTLPAIQELVNRARVPAQVRALFPARVILVGT